MTQRTKEYKPPRLAEWLVRRLYPELGNHAPVDDFRELYQSTCEKKNAFIADFEYWMQLIVSLFSLMRNRFYWKSTLFKNNLKIALRTLYKNRTYAGISVAGLALGMACAILTFMWVHHELSFDRFHENVHSLYRVTSNTQTARQIVRSARTLAALGPALVNEFPEIIRSTRYQCFNGTLVEANGKSLLSDYFAVGDPDFFRMFSFDFIHGDPDRVFEQKHSIVITESMARLYFGEKEALGEILHIQVGRTPFVVTGVIRDMPETSHLHFDAMMPFDMCVDWFEADPTSWKMSMYYTYIQTSTGVNGPALNHKIAGFVQKHDSESLVKIALQPMQRIHLETGIANDLDYYKQGDKKTFSSTL